MERRTFLKGALIASATPAAAWAPPRAETLASLFNDYETAMTIDQDAWDIAADIEDSEAMKARPKERIQISKMWVGSDENGDKAFRPIYAYSVDEIESEGRQNLETQLLFVGHNEAGKRRVEEKSAKIVAERIELLEYLKAECRRIEDACGYTAALERAMASSARVRAIEQAILDFVPATLNEAARKARWIVTELQGNRTYLHEREDIAQVALAAIGRAIG